MIEVEDSLTAFVQRIGLCTDGRSIRAVKDQLDAPCDGGNPACPGHAGDACPPGEAAYRRAASISGCPRTSGSASCGPRPSRCPPTISRACNATPCPLDERAIAALSHSAMALDVYCWLAQRLHRVEHGKPAFIPWTALQDQFGWHYGRIRQIQRGVPPDA